METVNTRIAAVIKKTGLTKTAFAKALNLSQPFVSNICTGVSSPSDRTISDICKTFGINETWLRTGAGVMSVEHSRDEEISELISQILYSESDSFKKRFISVLCRLNESQWQLLEDMIEAIFEAKGNHSMVEHSNGQMELGTIYNQLTPDGQDMLLKQARFLTTEVQYSARFQTQQKKTG